MVELQGPVADGPHVGAVDAGQLVHRDDRRGGLPSVDTVQIPPVHAEPGEMVLQLGDPERIGPAEDDRRGRVSRRRDSPHHDRGGGVGVGGLDGGDLGREPGR